MLALGLLEEIAAQLQGFIAWLWSKVSPPERKTWCAAFYFVAQQDFLEEVAKFRAARRVWAKIMKERFGATKAESMRLRFHCQTAAMTLTKAQPLNNIVRTALQALSAVLGGAQSLHTNGLDEAYAIPSELAMKIALRTQQIIADETHVADVVDPPKVMPALPIHFFRSATCAARPRARASCGPNHCCVTGRPVTRSSVGAGRSTRKRTRSALRLPARRLAIFEPESVKS
jgi:hypothetical protein